MQNTMSSLWGNEWGQKINSAVTFTVGIIRSVSIVGGAIAVNLVDVIFGALALSLVITKGVPIGGWMVSPAAIAWTLSVATTGIQTAFWDRIFALYAKAKRENESIFSFLMGSTIILIIVGLIMMALDTTVDSSIIGWFMDEEGPKLFLSQHFFANMYPMRAIITAMIAFILAFNEPITLLMLNAGKSDK